MSGLRRRGIPPAAIRRFCDLIGVGKSQSTVDMAVLEHAVRDELNKKASRVMGVLDPVKLVIRNYPEDEEEELEAVNNPEDASMGTRSVPFCRELYIERDDFREDPPRKFFRLAPGREVRLRYAYFVTCVDVVKDENDQIQEIHCTYDPKTRGGGAPDGRKVKGTLHWVSARHCLRATVRLYDRLFMVPDPTAAEKKGSDFMDHLNPDSLTVLEDRPVEPSLGQARSEERYQLERKGYFCVDPDSSPEKLILNRTVTLRDTWAKLEKKQMG
jgi:glutaminyl-tRNA synthetase